MLNVSQTNLRQTGVAVVLNNDDTISAIPLFSKDIVSEASEISKGIKRVLQLFRYNTLSEAYTNQVFSNLRDNKAIARKDMDSIRTGIRGMSRVGYPSDISCYA